MTDKLDAIVNDIKEAINSKDNKQTNAYDTTAEVKRVDYETGTAWVHIPGGVDETPIKLTVNASVGDNVQVRVSGGSAWIVGNASAPPTDDATAIKARDVATNAFDVANNAAKDAERAYTAAEQAEDYAEQAKVTTDEINAYAETAGKTITQILNDGETAGAAAQRAEAAAGEAKASAENASEYAARALGNLSTVQSVTETLTWITQHGTMALTTDTALDPTHVYFVQDASGDYVVGGTHYSVVTEPDVADIGTYYELSIDESLNNYVATHLSLTSEGLFIIKDNSGYRLKLTNYGSYIVAPDGTTVVNQNTADGNIIRATDGTVIAHLGYGDGQAESGTTRAPYFIFGTPTNTEAIDIDTVSSAHIGLFYKRPSSSQEYLCIANVSAPFDLSDTTTFVKVGERQGNYSVAEGLGSLATGYCSHAEGGSNTYVGDKMIEVPCAVGIFSHAEGKGTRAVGNSAHAEGNQNSAIGRFSHAEGSICRARGETSHAEGYGTTASGSYTHAQNERTTAGYQSQTAIGKYNDNQSNNAFEIGNGTLSARSNAFTVDWNGNVDASGDVTDGSGNVLSSKADTSSVPTATSDLTNDSGFITLSDLPDYVIEEGTQSNWEYRKWSSGKVEAWRNISNSAAAGSVWVSPLYYRDLTVAIPSGLFTAAPDVKATSTTSQWWVSYANATSATSLTYRLVKPVSSSQASGVSLYLYGE